MIHTLLTILGVFSLNTANTTIAFEAEKGKELKIAYYGSRVDNLDQIKDAGFASVSAYPAYGLIGEKEAAISAMQADGNPTLDLRVEDYSIGQWENGEILCVSSKDSYYPFFVNNYFKSYREQDMIETWVEIVNKGRKTVTLNRYFSGHLPFRGGNAWISTTYGTWGNEGRVCEEELKRGFKVIKNTDGVRNAQTSRAEAMISLDGKPEENRGRVIGAALCWGGNFELRFQSCNDDYNHFFAGICPDNAQYHLRKNETFTSPVLAYSFSKEGLSGVSRNFHSWGRKYRLAHGDKERDVLLNSWEGVYFDINEAGMKQMMQDIAYMGGELFVMDDGWFGDKYPRLNDHSSLGDWVVDKNKLPNGIGQLVKNAKQCGIKFGIWIEPEMTNNPSELFEKHPDWAIHAANRDRVYGRGGTQLVLNLSKPEVQDYVVKIVDDLMTENPDIAYIKWDANMNIREWGADNLEHQSHLNVEYWRGFEKACRRIRAKYPELTIQACASGGGRANWGILPYFDEFWVSDNTDALQRIHMQWGTSYFFPAIAMASHISATPNHAVHRTTSLKYRIDVAMSGRLGMEIQPKNMTSEEKDFCRNAIEEYKRIRPVVQFGDIYRLVAPHEGKNFASMMYSSKDKSKAVFYWWRTETLQDDRLPRVQMAGLDPERLYEVKELNRIDVKPLSFEGKTFSGKFLMENGLEIPIIHNVPSDMRSDWSSRVLYLEERGKN